MLIIIQIISCKILLNNTFLLSIIHVYHVSLWAKYRFKNTAFHLFLHFLHFTQLPNFFRIVKCWLRCIQTWLQPVCCLKPQGRTGRAVDPAKPHGFPDGTGKRWAAAKPGWPTTPSAPWDRQVTRVQSPSTGGTKTTVSPSNDHTKLKGSFFAQLGSNSDWPCGAASCGGVFPAGRAAVLGPSEESPSGNAAADEALIPADGALIECRSGSCSQGSGVNLRRSMSFFLFTSHLQ